MKNSKLNIIILVAICFLVLFISLKDDFGTVMSQISQINIWWFLLACFLMMMFFILRAIEMRDLVTLVDRGYTFRKALAIVVIGQFFANVTPSSLGTQPAQIYFLNKDKIRISQGTRIVVQYNVTYQIALLIISLVTIVLAYAFNTFGSISTTLAFKELVVISFFIHVGVLLVLLSVNFSKGANGFFVKNVIKMLSFFKIVKNQDEKLLEWNGHLDSFHNDSNNIFSKKILLLKGIICNIFAILCMYTIPLILIYAIGDFKSLEIIGTTIASSYTNIISSFMPSPGGTGGFEYFFTQFFGVFITGATLTTIMLLWRAVTYYFVLLVGSIMLLFYRERDVVA